MTSPRFEVFVDGDQVSMRRAIEGNPHRNTAVGTVIGGGHTANEGNPYVTVNWPGAEGGTDTYHPDRLVRVARDRNGIPRAI
ncbi:hypothetical protein [Microtetraspora malaysiensis]|uniref:ASPIC/UnbV domain-containing protein n=1 Tax=Microtetraspora malaysiensis TaxID=161358 RepID=A0ABW6SKJ8_9ACTN